MAELLLEMKNRPTYKAADEAIRLASNKMGNARLKPEQKCITRASELECLHMPWNSSIKTLIVLLLN